jgi:hypothetical protein
MFDRIDRIMDHVSRHRAKYAAGATTLVFLRLMYLRGQEWNEFLKEQGIYDEFYAGQED